jgi:hypothetical protein
MLGNSIDRGARPNELLSQRQIPGYRDEDDDLMSGVTTWKPFTILV